jgi:hypothetical protein
MNIEELPGRFPEDVVKELARNGELILKGKPVWGKLPL